MLSKFSLLFVADANDGDALAADIVAFVAYDDDVPDGDAIVLCKLVSILLLVKFIFNSIAWFLPLLYWPPVCEYKRLLFFGSCLIIMLLASIICSWYRGLATAPDGTLPNSDDVGDG